jgi:hypothetical protein
VAVAHVLGYVRPSHVQALDSTEHMADLQAVGRAVGAQVKAEHFLGY